MTKVPQSALDVSHRFSNIRPMLDRRITDSEYVIGAYVMTACVMMASGDSDEEIVDALAKHGTDKRAGWR